MDHRRVLRKQSINVQAKNYVTKKVGTRWGPRNLPNLIIKIDARKQRGAVQLLLPAINTTALRPRPPGKIIPRRGIHFSRDIEAMARMCSSVEYSTASTGKGRTVPVKNMVHRSLYRVTYAVRVRETVETLNISSNTRLIKGQPVETPRRGTSFRAFFLDIEEAAVTDHL